MGKIAQPTQQEAEVTRAPKEDQGLRATNNEVIKFLSGTIEPSENGDYNLTNEAVRLIQLKKELNLDPTDTEHDNEIKSILDWASKVGIKNRNELVSKIREIDYKLGKPTNKSKLKKIYEWIVIDSSIKNLVDRQETLRNAD
jgi:hypothetical protein